LLTDIGTQNSLLLWWFFAKLLLIFKLCMSVWTQILKACTRI